MKSRNIYTSIACNRTTESADWGNNGLIVFAACNAVGIFDPSYDGNTAKILNTYVQHTKRVNTVKWLQETNKAKETYFFSGADDGLAILWNITNAEEPISYPLKGHECGVNTVSGLRRTCDKWLLATAAADSTLKLWLFDETTKTCENFQTLLLKSGFCFTLRLTLLPKSEQALLAFSTDDETVSLWVQQEKADESATKQYTKNFQLAHKLSGHEDWVRGLDFITEDDDLLLASSAQDNFIRLWRIAPRTQAQVLENKVDIFNLLDEKTGDIRVEEKILQLASNAWYAISLESVLYGHDGWVYGVHWHKSEQQELRLLSASIDKTLIIWEPTEDGVWMEKVRVGEVGGNSLGFFGGKFSSDGKSIMGHSYQGGFHIWNQSAEKEHIWTPNVIVGGHFGEVRDLAWEPQGEYLMSVSADQTSRIHAPWLRTENIDSNKVTWHELARPQVHGYDMQALALLNRYKFASGAEEKIVRTFQTSANFIENFRHISRIEKHADGDVLLASLPKGASVPSLGLSNKAVYNIETTAPEQRHIKDEYPENYFTPVSLETPPQEETLMQNTLWPELQKLYGHGYEIYALAASPDGRLLASSCRATNADHAQIIIWNTSSWKQIQKLAGHQLTVTQLRFSPDGHYLLSVSRDRRWCLFENQTKAEATDVPPAYTLAACTDKTNGVHTRIIWSCDWSHDGKLFATTSREGKVALWSHQIEDESCIKNNSLNGWQALEVLELKNESITAVAFANTNIEVNAYVVALGFESGAVAIYKFDGKWTLLLNLNNNQAHHLTVKRLQFRPKSAEACSNKFQLASCGDDHLVRIYELTL